MTASRRISAAVIALSVCLAFLLAGCAGSAQQASSAEAGQTISAEQSSTSNGEASEESSAESSDESKDADDSAGTVFGNPQVRPVLNGSRTEKIGTAAIFFADSSEVTPESLATWCDEYLVKSDDNWCVISYTDKEGYGVFTNGPGAIVVNSPLKEDEDGLLTSGGEDDEAIYYAYDKKGKKLIEI